MDTKSSKADELLSGFLDAVDLNKEQELLSLLQTEKKALVETDTEDHLGNQFLYFTKL